MLAASPERLAPEAAATLPRAAAANLSSDVKPPFSDVPLSHGLKNKRKTKQIRLGRTLQRTDIRSSLRRKMIRRYVHLIVDDLKSSYTLRRIDTAPLFAGVRKDPGIQTPRQPPRPVVCFDALGRSTYPDQTEFFLLGSKIVSISKNRRTILYDTSTSTISAGPALRHAKGFDPAWAAVQGKLYLANVSSIDDHDAPCFEALRFDSQLRDWSWDLLPSPPFSRGPFELHNMINSFAAAGDDKIWVSTTGPMGEGTYTFDVTTATWPKEGDWALPFEGQLQYIPDYNLCFGFCKESSNLCTADLIAAGGKTSEEPPRHMDVWEDVDSYDGAKGWWHLARSYLTYVGSGRFCVTRFYDTRRTECYVPLCDVAVMTAVEVKRSPGAGELQVTKGASKCYKFATGKTRSGWAL